MGKKLNRTAGKVRIEALQNQRKERISKAGLLLERWGQQDRMPVTGELELSEVDPEFIEDQMTAEVLSSLTAEKCVLSVNIGLKVTQLLRLLRWKISHEMKYGRYWGLLLNKLLIKF